MTQLKEKKIQLTEDQKFAIAEIVRSDLNLEKSPSIFIPSQGRGEMKTRIIEWERKITKDSSILSRIKISPNLDYGNLNTEDQKVLYALIKLWEEKGRPEVLLFSLRDLARILKKSWSTKTYNSLKDSLFRLRGTLFVWTKAYYDGVTEDYYDELDSFTILSDLKIAKRTQGRSVTVEACKIRFNEHLDKNLRSKHTQPSFYNQIIKFRSGLAQLIYQQLELVMHDKIRYERNSEGLFLEDLKLDSINYKYPSGRKRDLDVAVKELQNVLIPSGVINASIEKTKDNSDYKLVVTKEVQLLLALRYKEDEQQPENNEDIKSTNIEREAVVPARPELSLAEQIVKFFLEKFRVKRKESLKKEIQTAQEWIEKYSLDLEKAQIFVSKCKVWAAETDFDVQNFAGLRQYLDRTKETFEKIEVERAIKGCSLCDENGYVDGKEENGREFVFKCSHKLAELESYANQSKIAIKLAGNRVLEPK